MKELGFNWNGNVCSIQQLLQKLKEYLNPEKLEQDIVELEAKEA